MEIIRYSEQIDAHAAISNGEPMLAVISFDCKKAYMAHIDEALEHHILLAKVNLPGAEIDRYFRIVFDNEGADWTFVCPPDYKGIVDRARRIAEFYKDGFAAISAFLSEIGLFADIKIPRRYRRHFDELSD
ncbi:MAG: hypothetical protein LBR85_08115 [Oscillospiraceae bacterium]|jgi:hypothetical protein|nr:hypothetical protein [Oscillospiraceae bacterium]